MGQLKASAPDEEEASFVLALALTLMLRLTVTSGGILRDLAETCKGGYIDNFCHIGLPHSTIETCYVTVCIGYKSVDLFSKIWHFY